MSIAFETVKGSIKNAILIAVDSNITSRGKFAIEWTRHLDEMLLALLQVWKAGNK